MSIIHKSIRRLDVHQLTDLRLRVSFKNGAQLHRACPANHWSFRRIPSMLLS